MCEMTFPSIFASRSVGEIGSDFRLIDGEEMMNCVGCYSY